MAEGLRYWMTLCESMDADRQRVVEIATQVRADLSAYYDNEPFWSVSQCLQAAKDLEQNLRQAGLPAQRKGGYYNCCEDGYPEIVAKHGPDGVEPDDNLADWDGRWKHWWVVCGDLIVDITADQFHPSEPKRFEVVVTSIADPCYSGSSTHT